MPLTSPIPLLCNICPRRPNFSDVSHLLTHIASKGHLSHYYKLKVRSSTERSTKELIDVYDQWYRNWDVEKLMAERMRLKDRKKAKAQGSADGQNRHKERLGRSGRLGPSNEGFKISPEDNSAFTNTSRTHFSTPDIAQIRQNFASRIQLWDTSMLTPVSSSISDYEHNGSSFDATDRASFGSMTNNSSAVSISFDNDEISIDEDSFVADNARLKGILWPGMDIFDSATPEMRRKRNQKKDVSVVEQLKSNSLEVEPTEVIFAPDGTEWRSRAISGMPYDDGYPFLDFSPSHQQLHTCERAPLSEIDGNRLGSSNNNPTWSRQNRRRIIPSAEKSNENLVPRSITTIAEAHKSQPATRESARKRKKEFDVFKDEVNFSNPAGLSYLTAELASPGPAASKVSRNHNDKSVCSREGSMNNQHRGFSKECRSRRDPRRSCQPHQRQTKRYASSSLAFPNRNGDYAIPSSCSPHFTMDPNAHLSQHAATSSNLDANQRHVQLYPQSQLDQQQEQQNNHLLFNYTTLSNDAYFTPLQGPFHQSSETVAKLGSVLQDFPYYLSQMPYLTDTLAASSNFENISPVDPVRYGHLQRSRNPNIFIQNGLQADLNQGSFNTYDLPIEEQLKLYETNEAIDNNGRGLGGSLQHSTYYQNFHQGRFVEHEEAEVEDDQKTISAPPSER